MVHRGGTKEICREMENKIITKLQTSTSYFHYFGFQYQFDHKMQIKPQK